MQLIDEVFRARWLRVVAGSCALCVLYLLADDLRASLSKPPTLEEELAAIVKKGCRPLVPRSDLSPPEIAFARLPAVVEVSPAAPDGPSALSAVVCLSEPDIFSQAIEDDDKPMPAAETAERPQRAVFAAEPPTLDDEPPPPVTVMIKAPKVAEPTNDHGPERLPVYVRGDLITIEAGVTGEAMAHKWIASFLVEPEDDDIPPHWIPADGLRVLTGGVQAVFSNRHIGVYRVLVAVAGLGSVDVSEYQFEIIDEEKEGAPKVKGKSPALAKAPVETVEQAVRNMVAKVPSKSRAVEAKVVAGVLTRISSRMRANLLTPSDDPLVDAQKGIEQELRASAPAWKGFLVGLGTLAGGKVTADFLSDVAKFLNAIDA